MRARWAALGLAVSLLGLSSGCSKKAEDEPRGEGANGQPFTIYTVNYPLSYFATRMAPVGTRVVFPVPRGTDPAFWKPSSETIQEYQHADLIALNGAGYAQWTRYATLPASRMVVTAQGCRESLLHTSQSVEHQHGPEGEHAHSGIAFTTWLDFRLAACQASRIRDALARQRVEERDNIAQAFSSLERDLLTLDERVRRIGEAWGSKPLLASHPVYQYLADAYGLSIESLHLEPDEPVSDDDWEAVDAILERHSAELMLWEASPLQGTEDGLRSRGVEILVFEPAGQAPSDGDFLTVMRANVGRFECATGAKTCR